MWRTCKVANSEVSIFSMSKLVLVNLQSRTFHGFEAKTRFSAKYERPKNSGFGFVSHCDDRMSSRRNHALTCNVSKLARVCLPSLVQALRLLRLRPPPFRHRCVGSAVASVCACSGTLAYSKGGRSPLCCQPPLIGLRLAARVVLCDSRWS